MAMKSISKKGENQQYQLGLQNLNPRIWGPALWLVLHSISLAYPEIPSPESRYQHRMFLKNMAGVLPCSRCRGHFKEFINRPESPNAPNGSHLEAALRTKKGFIDWTLELHNAVNKRNNSAQISKEAFLGKYRELYIPTVSTDVPSMAQKRYTPQCSEAYKELLGVAKCATMEETDGESTTLTMDSGKCDCTVDDEKNELTGIESFENSMTTDIESLFSRFRWSDFFSFSFWQKLSTLFVQSIQMVVFSKPMKFFVMFVVALTFFFAVLYFSMADETE